MAPEVESPGRKAIVVRSAFEGFSLASFLSYVQHVQVKVNTKECLFDKSSSPHNCHISLSSSKNSAYIFTNTRSATRLIVSLSIFSRAPLQSELIYFQVNLSSKLT